MPMHDTLSFISLGIRSRSMHLYHTYVYIYDIQFFLLLERRKSIILALITHLHMHYSSLLSSSSSPPYTVSILPTNQFHSIRQFHSLHSIVIILSLDETNICDTDHSLTHSLTHSLHRTTMVPSILSISNTVQFIQSIIPNT